MFDKKKKIKVCFAIVSSAVIVFLLGLCVGIYCFNKSGSKKVKFEAKQIRFYAIKKMLGKELAKDEQEVVKTFKNNAEECLNNKITKEEKEVVESIKDEVLEMAENNDKIVFRIKDLNSCKDKNNIKVAKKILSCNRVAKKALTKEDRKLLYKAASKMQIKDVIKLYNAIK